MSGGRLVVLDRSGRAVKSFPLAEGQATLGSDTTCDIRIFLSTISPHHATVVVNTAQAVVHAVSERETLVNGARVTVAALRHGDVISLGGRALRWEYDDPAAHRPLALQPVLQRRVQRKRAVRCDSEPSSRNVIVQPHRSSMPAAVSGRQVAIVQPQRRDTSDLSDATSSVSPIHRVRASKSGPSPDTDMSDRTRRKVSSPRTLALANPTKASLWIESRKSSPRKSIKPQTSARTPAKTPLSSIKTRRTGNTPSNIPLRRYEASSSKTPTPQRNVRKVMSSTKSTPLRMMVLKKAQSAQKMRVTKIQAPSKIDSTKQAAIMLMARHTPKQQDKRPSLVVTKRSPVNKTPKPPQRSSGRQTPKATPNRSTVYEGTQSVDSQRSSDSRNDSLIEISDSNTASGLRGESVNRRSGSRVGLTPLPSPRKSALKDPRAKRTSKKTESIKFDLSNLESHNRSSDVMIVDDTKDDANTEFTLRYSDSSSSNSPSPRASTNRTNRTSDKRETSVKLDRRSTRTDSPQLTKSPRALRMVERALENSNGNEVSTYSQRLTRSLDPSRRSAVSSRSLSPQASRHYVETYSIIDLVSMDSDSYSSRSGSMYNSAASNASYDTALLGSSTPYRSKGICSVDLGTSRLSRGRALIAATNENPTSDVTTPENTEDATKIITFNSTRISRASKSRSRINDSDVLTEEEDNSSPKSSKRPSKSQASPLVRKTLSVSGTPSSKSISPSSDGTQTPENRRSPDEATTPVLNIQSLLDASHNSIRSPKSANKRNSKRKSSEARRSRISPKSPTKSLRGRDLSVNFNASGDYLEDDEEVVTPKSAVKLVQEAVKNKHSTAKKPQSKRSIIDDLEESDIVKQLFNSPVKRKLSQSMTEFSRKQLFEDDEVPVRLTRSHELVTDTLLDNSLTDRTEAYTPDMFVSTLNTRSRSPNMAGIKRLFQKNTPENDLQNVRGVKRMLRTPRARKSIRNDLTRVSGVKAVFARSPRNRLSDVRVKRVFAGSPNNDLRRVSGVKALFQSQRKKKSPKNDLTDVRGVRNLYRDTRRSPQNDLTNVRGVRSLFRRGSPQNDLSDVRGVKQLFRQEIQRNDLSQLSGIEQLFHESDNLDTTFDLLMGRPAVRSYGKAKSLTIDEVQKKNKKAASQSLHDSLTQISANVEEWLENKLRDQVQKNVSNTSASKAKKSITNASNSVSKINISRELQMLSTDTVEGSKSAVIVNRTRNNTSSHEQSNVPQRRSALEIYGDHTLPIKKRSLVNASANTSKDTPSRSKKLPIKKRAVVHSTPVKGRVDLTMNVSELHRMSPIPSASKAKPANSFRQPPQRKSSPKAKATTSKQSAEPKDNENKSSENKRPSPRRTRRSKAVQNTTVSKGRKSINESTSKKRQSLVITKKAPIYSPKPSPKTTRRGRINQGSNKESSKPAVSPKKTRSTRGQKSQVNTEIERVTPKKSGRTKARVSLVVAKPSPKLKPRATRQTKDKAESSTSKPLPARGKRKVQGVNEPQTSTKTDSPTVEPSRKTRKTNAATEAKDKVNVENSTQTRGSRKAVQNAQNTTKNNAQTSRSRKATETKALQPKATNTRTKPEPQSNVPTTTAKRGRRAKADSPQSKDNESPAQSKPTTSRGRTQATEANKMVDKPTEQATTATGRGRKRKNAEPLPTADPAPKRGRKANVSDLKNNNLEVSVPKTRRGTAAETNKKTSPKVAEKPETTARGRKRKITEPETTATETQKTTQTRRALKVVDEKQTSKSRKKVSFLDEAVPTTSKATQNKPVRTGTGKATRAAAQKAVESKPTRGRKVPAVTEVPQSSSTSGRRKNADSQKSDAKESKKQPAKATTSGRRARGRR